ncbi:MAG: ribonuclease HI family protein [Phycisphaerae bacterium]|nr:ribonuclease HI family protein [Phycisphaerae bacterium]
MGPERLRVKIFTDGGARGNPGPAACGYVLIDAEDDQTLQEAGHFLGRATNNVAEYEALVRALTAAADLRAAEAEIYSDSELLVRQMNGDYRVKNAGLKCLHERARRLEEHFDRVQYTHVRREHNERADRLVNRAINRKQDVFDAEE